MGNFFKRRKSDRVDVSPQDLIELASDRHDDDRDLEIPAMPEDNMTAPANQETPETHAPKASVTPPQDAAIFTFIGASGGVGTTTLATQIAYDLAIRQKQPNPLGRPEDPQVCLIDLDFETGATAYFLDLPPSISLAELSSNASRIDTAFTSALVSTHSSGVSLLAAPNAPGGTGRINPQAVLAMLDAASKLYKYVVIDMPRHQQAWSLPIMAGSDFVGIVTELTVPALHLTRMQIDQIDKRLGERCQLHPIVSKYERRSLRNSLRLTDAEKALNCEIWETMCIDADTARESLNCGEPVGAMRPDSRLAKNSRRITDKLIKIAEQRGQKTLSANAA